MFKKIITIFIVCISLLSLTSCNKGSKKVDDFPEFVNNLESYKVTGKLYSVFPTGTKESLITVYFQKPEMYRVEIDNETNGDKQIILKSGSDVFVLLPSVNKSFKLKSGWPINSSYSYLLQSISKDYVNDDDKLIKEEEDVTKVEMKVKLFENAAASKEVVTFSNETGLPTEVSIFDDTNNLMSRFVFLNIEQNPKLDSTLFKKQDTLTSSTEIFNSIEYNREKTYPTFYPVDTKLEHEKTYSNELNERTYIMTFGGSQNYTIIEQEVLKSETKKTAYVDGDIYILGDAVSIIGTSSLTFFQSGMEYTVASTEVNMYDLIKMAYSLIVYDEK